MRPGINRLTLIPVQRAAKFIIGPSALMKFPTTQRRRAVPGQPELLSVPIWPKVMCPVFPLPFIPVVKLSIIRVTVVYLRVPSVAGKFLKFSLIELPETRNQCQGDRLVIMKPLLFQRLLQKSGRMRNRLNVIVSRQVQTFLRRMKTVFWSVRVTRRLIINIKAPSRFKKTNPAHSRLRGSPSTVFVRRQSLLPLMILFKKKLLSGRVPVLPLLSAELNRVPSIRECRR